MRGRNDYEQAALQGRLWTPIRQRAAGNLLAWYDFADLSPSATAYVDDKSGNGLHAAQTLSTAQPTRSRTAFQYGLPSFSFDGADGVETLSLSVPAGTLVQVFATLKPQWGGSYERVVSLQPGLAGNDYDGGRYIPLLRDATTDFLTSYYQGSLVGVAAAPGVPIMGSAIVNGTQHQIFVNGVGGTVNSFTYPAAFAPTRIMMGMASTLAAGTYIGSIVEVLLLGGGISTNDRQRIEGYSAWRHMLVSSLPASHPFKNRPPLIGD